MGADSIRTSNFKDHATTDQHTHATLLSKKEQAEAAGQGPSSYAPVAKALHHLSEDAKGPLRAKCCLCDCHGEASFFQIPNSLARHGVNIGTSYLNHSACI